MKKPCKKYIKLYFFLCLISIFFIYVSSIYTKQELFETKYIVKEGDTLWLIASKEISNEDNINEFIYQLRKDNNINDSSLEVGQVLIIKKRLTK